MSLKKIHFKQIDSTNNYSRENIDQLADKTVVYADVQTAGKGRNSRTWLSSELNNLYFSLVLKPKYNLKHKNFVNLTHYTAVVLVRVFNVYGVDAKIKWPNDILVDGKKIAGILIETAIKGDVLLGIVLGVGVNLNFTKEALSMISKPATSLNILLNKTIDRDKFLDVFLNEFFCYYLKLLNKGFLFIRDEYIHKSMFLNKQVKVEAFGEVFKGIARNVDDEGRLILDDDKIINVGDIIC